jgi:bacterial polymer biosynthesis proteins, WecB/TagA/CpsF family
MTGNPQRPVFPTVKVAGFQTASITRQQLAEVMRHDCMQARLLKDSWLPKAVFSSNGQGIALAQQDRNFANAMAEADIVHADGMPVVFASRMTAHPLPERIATTDFFHDAAAMAVTHGLKFFILGSTEEQNRRAVEQIRALYPELHIAGRHHGYFGEEKDGEVCDLIRASGADVLWVALGKPRQEYWSLRNRERLKGVGWIKTCGGLYAFLAGDAPRAPRWMQQLGLEWLYRLKDDPARLAVRYMTTNPRAFYALWRKTERNR